VSLLGKYKIEIDRTMCMACGACCSSNPTHFEPDPEGKSTVVAGETDNNSSSGSFNDEEIANAREAEDACPASAITVTIAQ
jgi:ferredoxin